MLISNEVEVKRRGWPKGKARKPKAEGTFESSAKVRKAKNKTEHVNAHVLPNRSGVIPFEFKVLVRPDVMEEKTKGGIILPELARDDQQRAIMKGTLVALSPAAFSYHNWDASVRTPQVGDRVVFARYSGSLIIGKDEVEYRIINDKDIGAIIEY